MLTAMCVCVCVCVQDEGLSPDLMFIKHRDVQLTRCATLTRDADKRLRRVADPSNVPGRAAAGCWHWCVRARRTCTQQMWAA